MKVPVVITLVLLLGGCSSADEKARALLSEARLLQTEARAQIWSGKVMNISRRQVEACIAGAAAAKAKVEELHVSYGNAPVANEMGTRLLEGQINSVLADCNRLQERYARPHPTTGGAVDMGSF